MLLRPFTSGSGEGKRIFASVHAKPMRMSTATTVKTNLMDVKLLSVVTSPFLCNRVRFMVTSRRRAYPISVVGGVVVPAGGFVVSDAIAYGSHAVGSFVQSLTVSWVRPIMLFHDADTVSLFLTIQIIAMTRQTIAMIAMMICMY